MKVVLTSMGDDLKAAMDPHFGRARKYILFDTETGEWAVHDNTPNLQAAQGAGIQAAEFVARLGAEAVISGHVGPKAFRVLNSTGIGIYLKEGGTINEAIEDFKKGELPEAGGADREGHWV
ncbi:MAG TPA: NifB/NifX family molybdenum-iron cluster-binding protein [Kiritimatiellia bacterium]|nr:NifB/NifX family molybdenum-iron cluster-binding protein [Kiritimatiellia bacterium]HPA78586.1 NifB/NifX family molybdenum-iron cluster-binding protein [Kiritimatiellia bacterium]HQQ04651.1 NifB/NifX family molybdenum-iron cluster-binding protein [Kiritimatiellia bacterium]